MNILITKLIEINPEIKIKNIIKIDIKKLNFNTKKKVNISLKKFIDGGIEIFNIKNK